MSLSFLVLNAGGSTHASDDALLWARTEAERGHDVVLVQEVPSDAWLGQWVGYRVILGCERGWQVRSAILTRLTEDELVRLDHRAVPELQYHGDYVAAAKLVKLGITLFSVHASPNPTEDKYLADHPERDRLRPRSGGHDAKDGGKLFDADVCLDTVSHYGPVLAAGDWNEARGWDDSHQGHTWGEEFFGTLVEGGLENGRVQTAGLAWVPLSADGSEQVTRVAPNHPPLQLDHVLVSTELAGRVRELARDEAWVTSPGAMPGLADHCPLRFDFI